MIIINLKNISCVHLNIPKILQFDFTTIQFIFIGKWKCMENVQIPWGGGVVLIVSQDRKIRFYYKARCGINHIYVIWCFKWTNDADLMLKLFFRDCCKNWKYYWLIWMHTKLWSFVVKYIQWIFIIHHNTVEKRNKKLGTPFENIIHDDAYIYWIYPYCAL